MRGCLATSPALKAVPNEMALIPRPSRMAALPVMEFGARPFCCTPKGATLPREDAWLSHALTAML